MVFLVDKRCVLFVALALAAGTVLYSQETVWTQTYHQSFHLSCKDTQALYKQNNTILFTQLIVSWNAKRPTHGHFSVSVRVHNATKNQWGSWLNMSDWGSEVQRSHFRRGKLGERACYVRLELPEREYADGFSVRIETHDGACLEDLNEVTVGLSNMTLFAEEERCNYSMPSFRIRGVRPYSQMSIDHERAHHMCSPTSLTMVLSFLLKHKRNPLQTAHSVFDSGLNVFGSWPFNSAYAYDQLGDAYRCYVQRLHAFKELYQILRRGIPVIVSVRGCLKNAAKECYPHGHLMVVVGWDNAKKQVLCYDPAFDDVSKVPHAYDGAEFVAAWERSRRLAYVIEKK